MVKADQQENIHIVKGKQRHTFKMVPKNEPIPMRPPGYFANLLSKAEAREENSLAKSSVIRAPKDLE